MLPDRRAELSRLSAPRSGLTRLGGDQDEGRRGRAARRSRGREKRGWAPGGAAKTSANELAGAGIVRQDLADYRIVQGIAGFPPLFFSRHPLPHVFGDGLDTAWGGSVTDASESAAAYITES